MEKRKNGTGCVRFIGENRNKPWQVIISHKKMDGNRIRIHLGCFRKQKEALEYLNVFLEHKKPRSITVDKLFQLFKKYFTYHYPNKNYKIYRMGEAYCQPIHQKKVSEITLDDLKTVLIHGYRTDEDGNRTPTTHSTMEKIKSCFNNLLDYAYDHFFVSNNIAREVSLKKLLS